MSQSPAGPAAVPAPSNFGPLAPPVAARDDAVGVPAVSVETCANCLGPVSGHFCGACGAPRLEDRPLTVRRFAEDLWNEVSSLDSGTMRSFRALLLAPGLLTREYLRGRTRWYLSPLKLFLLATTFGLVVRSSLGIDDVMRAEARRGIDERAAITAKAHPVAKAAPGTVQRRRPPSLRRRRAEREIEAFFASTPELITSISANQWVKLLDPFIMAAAMLLIYRRLRRNYAEHVVHAMHLMAFAMLVSVIVFPLMVLDGTLTKMWSLPMALNLVVLLRYTFVSAQRVHARSTARTLFDSVLLVGAAQGAVFISLIGAFIAMALWTLVRVLATAMLS